MPILITLLALSIVVFVHEFGHLIAAKRSGIGVSQFSVGFGPVLFQKTLGSTVYALRLLPFGGFVRVNGLDDPFGDQAQIENSYYNAAIWKRAVTIAAGSVFNLLLGFLVFLVVFGSVGDLSVYPTLREIMPDSPAAEAGLLPGDTLTKVNGNPIVNMPEDVITIVADGRPVLIDYERDGQGYRTQITPTLLPGQSAPKIGILFAYEHGPMRPDKAIIKAGKLTYYSVGEVFLSIKLLIQGKVDMADMAGPIGIVQFASYGLKSSLWGFLVIMAKISISIGMLNLFPLPILDGGHLVMLALEAIRGKRLPQRVEILILNIGSAAMITLMILVIGNDILSWESRTDLLENLGK